MLGEKTQNDALILMNEALTKIYAIAKEEQCREIVDIIKQLDKELEQIINLPEDE
jgi:hypothetical protein